MAQNKKFWLLVVSFFFALVIFGVWSFRNNHMQPLTYAGRAEEFQVQGVPNFALPLLDGLTGASTGKFVKLANLEDQVVLVNFWASWCVPCKVEFPSLVDLARKYEKRATAGAKAIAAGAFDDDLKAQPLRVIAVSVDTDVAALNEFLAGNKIPFPSNFQVLADPQGDTATRYGTSKLPETYILDRQHKLLRKVIDQQNWVSPEFLSVLEKFMGPHP